MKQLTKIKTMHENRINFIFLSENTDIEKFKESNLVIVECEDDLEGVENIDNWEDWEGNYFLRYSDGNNIKILFIEDEFYWEKIDIVDYKDKTGNPGYVSVRDYELENGEILTLESSNVSGSLTPFWTEETVYC